MSHRKSIRNSNNIRVCCRVRPLSIKERKDGSEVVVDVDEQLSLIRMLNEGGHKKEYAYDSVFAPGASQSKVYSIACKGMVADILKGINITILAYGQTGCLKPDTPVRMFDWSVKRADEIKVGDILMGDDYTPRKVQRLYMGIQDMYLVKQKNAENYTVNRGHVLTLFDERTNSPLDVSISEYFKLTDERKSELLGFRVFGTGPGSASSAVKTPIEILPLGVGKYNGFMLDGNHRFLLGDFTVTHNSGKSYSMTGYSNDEDTGDMFKEKVSLWKNPDDMGIVPRLLKNIFEQISVVQDKNIEYTVRISYIEIYLEKIRDLLNPKSDNLMIRESRTKGIWVDSVTDVYADSYSSVLKTMRKGEENRTVGETAMNHQSSRSHSVLIVNIDQRNKNTNGKVSSRMVFVDLAGSEKVRDTKADGLRLKEAQQTNKSLSALGRVIKALTKKEPHVPYRDSKLTRLLTDSLGGNSKTCLLITASPSPKYAEETLSTLRFGSNVKTIINRPHVNREETAEVYKGLLKEAEMRILKLRGKIEELETANLKLYTLCKNSGLEIPSEICIGNIGYMIGDVSNTVIEEASVEASAESEDCLSEDSVSQGSASNDTGEESFEMEPCEAECPGQPRPKKDRAKYVAQKNAIMSKRAMGKTYEMEYIQQIAVYKDREEKLADVIRQKLSEVAMLSEENDRMYKYIEHLEADKTNSSELKSLMETYRTENAELVQTISSKSREIQLLQSQLQKLREELQSDPATAETLIKTVNDILAEKQDLEKQEDHVQKMNQGLNRQMASIQSQLENEKKASKEQVHQLRKEIDKQKAKIRNYEKEIEELRSKQATFITPVSL